MIAAGVMADVRFSPLFNVSACCSTMVAVSTFTIVPGLVDRPKYALAPSGDTSTAFVVFWPVGSVTALSRTMLASAGAAPIVPVSMSSPNNASVAMTVAGDSFFMRSKVWAARAPSTAV